LQETGNNKKTMKFYHVLAGLWSISLLSVAIAKAGNDASRTRPLGPDGKPVNILMILADDLGFGDTSVPPFTGSGIATPNLQRMANNGVVLSNFHSAATTCSPSRAAILTGMYPWRVGMKSVFEYGAKSHNRDDWLVQVPTAANLFASANYSTFHSGKWHLGGMRNDDYDMRMLKDTKEGAVGARRCHHPGPNQQGFQNYVSVLDGPGSPRQNHLQVQDKLYSEGCNFLLHNDEPISKERFNITGWLTYCEAKHAMRGMKESLDAGKPFYIHLWFHAPHGPWQVIPGYPRYFTEVKYPRNAAEAVRCDEGDPEKKKIRFCAMPSGKIVDRAGERMAKYVTMVMDMDAQIGMILRYLEELGIEKNTFVFFTSDNGAEDAAGMSGGLRGNKRHIYEGGIRVPAIAQWIGTFPAGGIVNTMSVNTDLLPTFADAAGIAIPDRYHLDGISILPELLNAINPSTNSLAKPKQGILHLAEMNEQLALAQASVHKKKELKKRHNMLQERMVLWANDFEGPKRTVAVAYDYKFILDEHEIPMEIFDLRNDVIESHNLLLPGKFHENNFWAEFKHQRMNISKISLRLKGVNQMPSVTISKAEDIPFKLVKSMITHPKSTMRSNVLLNFYLLYQFYPLMYNYEMQGQNGYTNYMRQNPEIKYPATPLSDNRPLVSNVHRQFTPAKMEQLKNELLHKSSCPVSKEKPKYVCSCEVSTISSALPLPFISNDFIQGNIYRASITPTPFLNSSMYLKFNIQ
jgi:arylsulfatase A